MTNVMLTNMFFCILYSIQKSLFTMLYNNADPPGIMFVPQKYLLNKYVMIIPACPHICRGSTCMMRN